MGERSRTRYWRLVRAGAAAGHGGADRERLGQRRAGSLRCARWQDGNVIYSFHYLRAGGADVAGGLAPGLDRTALARLPFPAEPEACARLAGGTDGDTSGVIRFYCALHWDAGRVAARIATAAAWGRRHHAAVLLGEFGASAALAPIARTAWLRAVRQACEAEGIGWTLWGYDDVMGFGAARPPGRQPVLDAGVLRALGLAAAM